MNTFMITRRDVSYMLVPGLIRSQPIDLRDDVYKLLKIEKIQLLGQKREVVEARMIISTILQKYYSLKPEKIADIVRKERTTVLYLLGKHDELFEVNFDYRNKYNLVYNHVKLLLPTKDLK